MGKLKQYGFAKREFMICSGILSLVIYEVWADCVGIDSVWASPPSTIVEVKVDHFINGGVVFGEIVDDNVFEVEFSFFHFFDKRLELTGSEF